MAESHDRFARVLKARAVLALSFGAMIGWSWVLMTGHWVENAGSVGTLMAFAGGGLVIGFIGLTYAELASAMPRAGGEHVYTHAALGANWSFVCTWALLMAYATVCVFESVALPTAVEYLYPGIRLGTLWTVVGAPVDLGFVLVGVLGAVAMTVVNYLGIRTAGRVQMVVTVAIVAAGLLLFVGALGNGSFETARPLIADPAIGILTVVIMVPAMLVGFDVLPQSAEEIDLPARRIGILLAVSLVLAVLWYAGVSFAVASAIPKAALGEVMATADAATALWNGPWAGSALIVGGIGGILTSWNAFIIGGSRVMFALAESGALPASFGKLHPRYRTPYVAILVLGLLSCISPFFGRTILVWLINTGSLAVVVAYVFVPIAFLVLRKQQPQLPRPFRVRAPRLVGWTAILLGCALLCLYLPGSPSALAWPYEWVIVAGWGIVGAGIWVRRVRR
ncbi:MAG: amino acid permease [Gammaproteobacteria bacterium]|nr:amino acid permease [Gammaproteobacteria bacterium]MYF27917.1 amino acid permease [Gammaproteobacteria bacterium]MYK45592.1 amino acid permease [Gammaproteobacteria bacterium]